MKLIEIIAYVPWVVAAAALFYVAVPMVAGAVLPEVF